jgi:hypothetical protein
MRLTVLLLLISTVCFAAPEDLVSVAVQGTTIDRMPKAIDILNATPAESAKALVQRGGKINRGIPHSVHYRDVFYIFTAPAKWLIQGSKRLAADDVIYTFLVDTKKAREEFVKTYDLTPFGKLVEREGHAPILYLASPHHYVLVMTPEPFFTCSMHPQIHVQKGGKCPICGMDLMETESYR